MEEFPEFILSAESTATIRNQSTGIPALLLLHRLDQAEPGALYC